MLRKKLPVLCFPAICMTVLAAGYAAFPQDRLFGFFVLSLVLLFPVLFAVQGLLCAIQQVRFLPALGISMLAFALVTFSVLEDSVLGYLLIYSGAGLAGYAATRLLSWVFSKRPRKPLFTKKFHRINDQYQALSALCMDFSFLITVITIIRTITDYREYIQHPEYSAPFYVYWASFGIPCTFMILTGAILSLIFRKKQ